MTTRAGFSLADDDLSGVDVGAMLRAALDNLDAAVMMPWPREPISEILARCEALVSLIPDLEPVGPVTDRVLRMLRTDVLELDEVHAFGLLHGPICERYEAIAAAVANA